MGLLTGRRGLIVGIANERSLAYGIAKAAKAEGAELAVTYQNELMKKRVGPIAQELGAFHVAPCDLGNDAE
ncbi:MAG TPA: SDR family oxidoreductase, partial [Myxococcota bacterium]|nr:SDR family oxidoreductase [Myxococcota bacterium]